MKRIFNNINLQTILSLVSIMVIGILVQGCKKEWLEAKVDKKLAVPSTVRDFQAILDNFNSLNRNTVPFLNEIAADGHYYTESIYNSFTATSLGKDNYLWKKRVPNTGVVDYSPYNTILALNVILDRVEKTKDQDVSELENVRAQALFHRGRMFFDLVQTFAPQYKVGSADSDLGIALRLSTDITEPSLRATVKQSYNQIVSDLLAAKDILPNTPSFLTRASKPAVLGMLAKVYLCMSDFENAFNYANEYLQLKNELLDYTSLSLNANFIGLNKEVAFFRSPAITPLLTTQYLIDQSLYDLYSSDDLRKQVFFKTGAGGITFKGHYSNAANDVFSGIATDEIYLVRAECYARKGNLLAAMKDLNDLLRMRWAKNINGTTKYIDQIAIDETDALKRIFVERRKELVLRGVRWSDLRRLNLDSRFKTTLTRTMGGQTYTLEPNSYKYTFAIPDDIIQMSNLQQNPGW